MDTYQYKYGDRPLEGYTIQRAAGRGGFGEVYYAISDSGRQVALKAVQSYEQIELRGISQCMNLKSPHLVTIFDVKHNDQGRPFIVMEYVSGPSLADLLKESPAGLGSQKAAFFLREVGKGLSFLHECGILHRDLKPGNIFYENGYVKIGDYGLTKAINTSPHVSQTIIVGTVQYMAPEVGKGQYGCTTDIYSLGILLYEMLTGQVPFLGSNPVEILMKHMTAAPDLINIEEPFARVIQRALAKDPAERYQSVQEMVEDVFGAEHVRNSVSQFAPNDLSIMAEDIAQTIRCGGPKAHRETPAQYSGADAGKLKVQKKRVQVVARLSLLCAKHVVQMATTALGLLRNLAKARPAFVMSLILNLLLLISNAAIVRSLLKVWKSQGLNVDADPVTSVGLEFVFILLAMACAAIHWLLLEGFCRVPKNRLPMICFFVGLFVWMGLSMGQFIHVLFFALVPATSLFALMGEQHGVSSELDEAKIGRQEAEAKKAKAEAERQLALGERLRLQTRESQEEVRRAEKEREGMAQRRTSDGAGEHLGSTDSAEQRYIQKLKAIIDRQRSTISKHARGRKLLAKVNLSDTQGCSELEDQCLALNEILRNTVLEFPHGDQWASAEAREWWNTAMDTFGDLAEAKFDFKCETGSIYVAKRSFSRFIEVCKSIPQPGGWAQEAYAEFMGRLDKDKFK